MLQVKWPQYLCTLTFGEQFVRLSCCSDEKNHAEALRRQMVEVKAREDEVGQTVHGLSNQLLTVKLYPELHRLPDWKQSKPGLSRSSPNYR